ncbi:hypothetical protein [Polyangium spumosum]|uniref:Uncharacterized protein n=1 Tax=Polyangium spumosum TaxID=889282 RepID=A0A6N7PGH5_9BACT|nr:hypothetical protein [Polyangium spumosum]MRG91212.1 hypothetical protein [Polyangium spumosum]
MHLHATVSIWQREHDGTYVAELDGYKLKLTWKPEAPGERRGFCWEAERDGKEAAKSDELFEEAEVAMAHAEHFAKQKAAS